ncbi:MAG: metallophosphoesterase [Candidatus Bipolaricaulota bacterium]|nr:metallophosphoesterase [Candidatus Bipolaricaulota bacterium]
MKRLLVVGDEVSPALERGLPGKDFGRVDLVLSCGDLPYDYLEYLVDAFGAPVLYVHGNHDRPVEGEGRLIAAPQGGISVEGRVVQAAGLLVAGLGGSPRYSARPGFEYSEGRMRLRVFGLEARLLPHRLRGRRLDVLVTHAPPRGIHDSPDPAHQGFAAFLPLLRRQRPRYHVHGHSQPRPGLPARTRFGDTEVVHVRGHLLLEVPDG